MVVCKNCTQPLSLQDNFCNSCGAQIVKNRLTTKSLFVDFYETFFSWEANRPIKTFIDLIKKPEVVIDGYMDGVRKKYLSPIGYVAIALTLNGIFFFILNKFFPGSLENMFIAEQNNEFAKETNKTILNLILEYYSVAFFAFIPLYALITWIIFLNKRKYNYAEHLILNFYAYAETSIFTALLMIGTLWSSSLLSQISVMSMGFQFIYYSYILKRIFNLTWLQLLIKILYFLLFFVSLFMVAIIIGIIISILRG